jgi:hypothetical protein
LAFGILVALPPELDARKLHDVTEVRATAPRPSSKYTAIVSFAWSAANEMLEVHVANASIERDSRAKAL